MKIFKTDWLGSCPVFYNETTGKISYNINDVIDFNNIEFHPEGLNNFLDFGFSVFEQTPIKNVKFLRYSSRIFNKDGVLKIEYLADPIDEWFEKNQKDISEEQVLNLFEKKLNKWEAETKGSIIIPTSGGFDSRILNAFIKDKTRIEAFTYGISDQQGDSFEVVYARNICQKLNIKWKQVTLGRFHNYFKEWDDSFGVSTHAHGMYHIEFYKNIKRATGAGKVFLSGIVGDAWAGSIKKQNIKNENDLIKLGYTHGMNADSKYSKLKNKTSLKRDFFIKNKNKINDIKYQTIMTIRCKIILLSYLIKLPIEFGFKAWSPFLDKELALSMLSINGERRKNRLWQRDFFKKNNLNIEDCSLIASRKNTLNHQAIKEIGLEPLNVNLLSEIIEETYIDKINETLICPSWQDKILLNLNKLPFNEWIIGVIRGFFHRIGLRDNILTAYNSYLTLKPLENLLKKRDNEK